MPNAFNFQHPPFNCLTPAECKLVQDTVDIAYCTPGSVLLKPGMPALQAYVLMKGHVQHEEAQELMAVYGPDDFFGARGVMAGHSSSVFTAADEVIAYTLPHTTLKALVAGNSRFSAMLFADLSRRLSAVAEGNESREFLSLMMMRVSDAFIRKPFFVDGGTDLITLCHQLSEHGLTNALIRDIDVHGQVRTGMFTTTDLRDALLRPNPPQDTAVRDVARFDLITVSPNAELLDALLLMIRHRVHRLLVCEGEAIVGVLSQLDLMSFISNHSHIIALQVEQAGSVDELKVAALQMDGLISTLHSGGVKTPVISKLVSELNCQIFAKLWRFVAPADLVLNSCLLIMGSEGRGEQILKTDQDNALLLRDDFECAALHSATTQFNAALTSFGYPQCPGNIMVTNPHWCQSMSAFKTTISRWLLDAEPDGLMNLAIFLDAKVVAGNTDLLHQAHAHMYQLFGGGDALLARFSAAAEQFSEPQSWWDWFGILRNRDEQEFDLKKLGTFPIVHGIRSLALAHQLPRRSTTERIAALQDLQQLEPALATDLVEALHFLMGLKLKNNLHQLQLGQTPHNRVRLSELGTLERDMLKDSLAIIKRFQQLLHTRFKLESL